MTTFPKGTSTRLDTISEQSESKQPELYDPFSPPRGLNPKDIPIVHIQSLSHSSARIKDVSSLPAQVAKPRRSYSTLREQIEKIFPNIPPKSIAPTRRQNSQPRAR